MTIYADPSYSLLILTEKYAVTSFCWLEDGLILVFILTTDLQRVEGSNELIVPFYQLPHIYLIEPENQPPQLILTGSNL